MTFRRARCVFCRAAVVGALFFLATSVRAQQGPKASGPEFLFGLQISGQLAERAVIGLR